MKSIYIMILLLISSTVCYSRNLDTVFVINDNVPLLFDTYNSKNGINLQYLDKLQILPGGIKENYFKVSNDRLVGYISKADINVVDNLWKKKKIIRDYIICFPPGDNFIFRKSLNHKIITHKKPFKQVKWNQFLYENNRYYILIDQIFLDINEFFENDELKEYKKIFSINNINYYFIEGFNFEKGMKFFQLIFNTNKNEYLTISVNIKTTNVDKIIKLEALKILLSIISYNNE